MEERGIYAMDYPKSSGLALIGLIPEKGRGLPEDCKARELPSLPHFLLILLESGVGD